MEGNVVPVSGVIDAPIARQEDRCLRRVVDFKRGDRAVTHYRVLTDGRPEMHRSSEVW